MVHVVAVVQLELWLAGVEMVVHIVCNMIGCIGRHFLGRVEVWHEGDVIVVPAGRRFVLACSSDRSHSLLEDAANYPSLFLKMEMQFK